MLIMLKAIQFPVSKLFCPLPGSCSTFEVNVNGFTRCGGNIGFLWTGSQNGFFTFLWVLSVYTVFFNLIFEVNAKFKTRFAVIGIKSRENFYT